MSPDRTLLSVIATNDRVHVQNALMTVSDRDLALALMCLIDRERSMVLQRISPSKARRVHAEVVLHQRLHIEYRQYHDAIQRVIARLRGEAAAARAGSYLRPRRPGVTNG